MFASRILLFTESILTRKIQKKKRERNKAGGKSKRKLDRLDKTPQRKKEQSRIEKGGAYKVERSCLIHTHIYNIYISSWYCY